MSREVYASIAVFFPPFDRVRDGRKRRWDDVKEGKVLRRPGRGGVFTRPDGVVWRDLGFLEAQKPIVLGRARCFCCNRHHRHHIVGVVGEEEG